MTPSPHDLTFEIHGTPALNFYVVERRHDGEDYPSTGSPLRTVSGPWLTRRGAELKACELELEAAGAAAA